MSNRDLTKPLVRRSSIHLNPLAILDRVIEEVELSPTQYAQAVQSYGAVTTVLTKPGMPIYPYEAFLFAQGSMRIGTTVRPFGKDVHDLDIMCLLRKGAKWLEPARAFELVWDTLGSDETYRAMRERKNRCIRLKYARRFNIDITPGIPQGQSDVGPLFVVDRDLEAWCSSHPVGFADWFEDKAKNLPMILHTFGANEGRVTGGSQVEPLPEHGAFDKTPLQRITQLLKRDRDEHFQGDLEHRPSSILLTTLVALAYTSETNRPTLRLIEFVINVVARLHEGIAVNRFSDLPPYLVLNPVNVGENFAEKWGKSHYERFRTWQNAMVGRLRAVADTKGQGADCMLKRLSEGFGEEKIISAANSLGADTSRLHQTGLLRVQGASGLVAVSGTAMGATVYHGA